MVPIIYLVLKVNVLKLKKKTIKNVRPLKEQNAKFHLPIKNNENTYLYGYLSIISL